MATSDDVPSADPYATLGVARTASPAEVRAAHRRLVLRCHPDLQRGDDGADARFRAVQAAYEQLRDPARRAAVDHALTRRDLERAAEAAAVRTGSNRTPRPTQPAAEPRATRSTARVTPADPAGRPPRGNPARRHPATDGAAASPRPWWEEQVVDGPAAARPVSDAEAWEWFAAELDAVDGRAAPPAGEVGAGRGRDAPRHYRPAGRAAAAGGLIAVCGLVSPLVADVLAGGMVVVIGLAAGWLASVLLSARVRPTARRPNRAWSSSGSDPSGT